MTWAYYNDNDAYCAQWLRNLIETGEIPPGDVDDRDIREVRASDLKGYRQVHFFCGIAGWPRALNLADWPDDRPVWTGSCPCQPLSSAGQRKGHADERHLWPAFYDLIAECRPPVVLGEQVASKDGREWLAGVRADLESVGYAVGAADLPAAGVGAPQIRQRLWWVADAEGYSSSDNIGSGKTRGGPQGMDKRSRSCGLSRGLADANSRERRPDHDKPDARTDRRRHAGRRGEAGGLAQSPSVNRRAGAGRQDGPEVDDRGRLGRSEGAGRHRRQDNDHQGWRECASGQASPAGFWDAFDFIPCADGKARRIESGTFPLATGVPNRVGRLRAYGNSICPPLAAEFIKAVMETT